MHSRFRCVLVLSHHPFESSSSSFSFYPSLVPLSSLSTCIVCSQCYCHDRSDLIPTLLEPALLEEAHSRLEEFVRTQQRFSRAVTKLRTLRTNKANAIPEGTVDGAEPEESCINGWGRTPIKRMPSFSVLIASSTSFLPSFFLLSDSLHFSFTLCSSLIISLLAACLVVVWPHSDQHHHSERKSDLRILCFSFSLACLRPLRFSFLCLSASSIHAGHHHDGQERDGEGRPLSPRETSGVHEDDSRSVSSEVSAFTLASQSLLSSKYGD